MYPRSKESRLLTRWVANFRTCALRGAPQSTPQGATAPMRRKPAPVLLSLGKRLRRLHVGQPPKALVRKEISGAFWGNRLPYCHLGGFCSYVWSDGRRHIIDTRSLCDRYHRSCTMRGRQHRYPAAIDLTGEPRRRAGVPRWFPGCWPRIETQRHRSAKGQGTQPRGSVRLRPADPHGIEPIPRPVSAVIPPKVKS